MEEPKDRVASAIAHAQADLEEALSALETMPAFDPGSTVFAVHALNNYVTVTSGTLELVLLRLDDNDKAQLRTWLEGAHHATNLMSRLVGQLLNPAATGEAPSRYEKFDLALLVQRACSFYQRVAGRKTIRITAGSTIDVPLIWADRVQVAAVLDNLLSNAVKYSPPGKAIWVQVRGEPGWAVCSVQDEGPGLSPADQARLFQRGARLTPRPTGGETSLGYGLAVAKQLAEGMGGSIWCESVLGQGCCFSFRLPGHREPAPGTETKSSDSEPKPGAKGLPKPG